MRDAMNEASARRRVSFRYTNHRGETAERIVTPIKIEFLEHTKWHPVAGWYLTAYCYSKQAERTFALVDIRDWTNLV